MWIASVEILTLILLSVCKSSRAGSDHLGYFEILSRGLSPQPVVPEGVQNVLLQLANSDITLTRVARLVLASGVLQSGGRSDPGVGQGGAAANTTTQAPTTQSPTTTPSPNPIPNALCVNQSIQVLEGLPGLEKWALRMVDASGKLGSGLMDLRLEFIGDYEECVAVTATPSEGTPFRGKYCKALIPFGASGGRGALPGVAMGISFGTCFPDSCNEEDVTAILNYLVNETLKAVETFAGNISIPLKFQDTVCQDEDLEWDASATAVFTIAMLFVVVLLLGTCYDIVFVQVPKWHALSAQSHILQHGDNDGHVSLNIKHHPDENAPLLDKEIVYRHEPSVCGKILAAFSLYSNGVKLLSTNATAGTLTAVHGIRFLSMTWIILGHTYFFSLPSVDNLITFAPVLLKRFTFGVMTSGTISVDTFFTISGLLVAYLTLKEMKKTGGKINWFMYYFHRYWRLTPPYMLVMMLYVGLFGYLATGPFWKVAGPEGGFCKESWWTNILYINNLVNPKKSCMGWAWYLANDMQFYVLSPLMVVPFFFSGVFGTISVLVFLLTTMTAAGVVSRVENLGVGLTDMGDMGGNVTTNTTNSGSMDYFFDYYLVPWCRMGPYIIGIVTGYILYKTDCKVRLSKCKVILGWSVATASALAVVYGLYDTFHGHPLTPDVSAFYNSVHRTVWGACVSWVIFACATGYGGYVNTLLSWKVLIPLSRLTYCAYLTHPIIMYYVFLAQHTLIHMTDVNLIFWFLGILMMTYMVAFVTSLAFESPMMGIERALLKREKTS